MTTAIVTIALIKMAILCAMCLLDGYVGRTVELKDQEQQDWSWFSGPAEFMIADLRSDVDVWLAPDYGQPQIDSVNLARAAAPCPTAREAVSRDLYLMTILSGSASSTKDISILSGYAESTVRSALEDLVSDGEAVRVVNYEGPRRAKRVSYATIN